MTLFKDTPVIKIHSCGQPAQLKLMILDLKANSMKAPVCPES